MQRPPTRALFTETPEALLPGLNASLLRLAGAFAGFDDTGLRDGLRDVYRQTLVFELLYERDVIAVAGSQGAGKTVLVKRLFGVDALLQDNEGRGERVPVLVEADDEVVEPRLRSWDLRTPGSVLEDSVLELVDIRADEWSDAMAGRRPQGLALQLAVPRASSPLPGQSVLLLPGYEIETSRNADWQRQMRRALAASSTGILVVDASRLAGSSTSQLAEDARKMFPDSEPIICITKTEGFDETAVAELVKSAMTAFDVHEDKRDRILTTHIDDGLDLPSLIAERSAKYGRVSREARAHQRGDLEGVVGKDLGAALSDCRRAAEDLKWDDDDRTRDADQILRAFDQSASLIRERLVTGIRGAMETHVAEATRLAKKDHKHNDEGWRAKIVGFFRSASEREERSETRLRKAWKSADERGEGFTPVLGDVMGSVVAQRLSIADVPSVAGGEAQKRALSLRWEDDSVLPTRISRDLELLAHMGSDLAEKPSEEFRAALELLPILALEFMRTSVVLPELVTTKESGPYSGSALDMNELANLVEQLGKNQKRVLVAAAGVLGLDAMDGQIDTIPALVAALKAAVPGAGGGTAATAVGTALGGVVALAVVAAGTAVVVNAVRRQDVAERYGIGQTMVVMGDVYAARCLDAFDETMLGAREVLASRITRWFQLDSEFARRQWAAKTLADTRTFRSQILEAIAADPRLAS